MASPYTEQIATFGPGGRIVGIVTDPAHGLDRRETAVLLLNAGTIHRVGPQRLWVTLARHLAGRGFTVLRFDHSGLGDSAPREDAVSFEESSARDVDDAMRWLEAERGRRRFAVLGLCASTLTGFRAAQRDTRVESLVLLTALLEDPSTVPDDVIAEATGRRVSRSYVGEKAGSATAWRRLLTGQADPRKIARTLWRFAVPRRREPDRPTTLEALQGLERLLARGVQVCFLFPEPSTVREYFGMTLERHVRRLERGGRLRLHVLKGADHTFTRVRDQSRVTTLASEWLTSRCP